MMNAYIFAAGVAAGLVAAASPAVMDWATVEAVRSAVTEYHRTGAAPDGWLMKNTVTSSGERLSIFFEPGRSLTARPTACDPLDLVRDGHGDVGVVDEEGRICGPHGQWLLEPKAFGLDADTLRIGTIVVLKRESLAPISTPWGGRVKFTYSPDDGGRFRYIYEGMNYSWCDTMARKAPTLKGFRSLAANGGSGCADRSDNVVEVLLTEPIIWPVDFSDRHTERSL